MFELLLLTIVLFAIGSLMFISEKFNVLNKLLIKIGEKLL